MDANPAGFQSCVFGELLSDLQVLKVGMPGDAGYKPLPPQGKSSECEFFPNRGSLHWLGFMARLFLSLSYAFSFARYVGIPQLVSSPHHENCSVCSYKFAVSPGRSGFRILPRHRLRWSSVCGRFVSAKPSTEQALQRLLNE